MITRRLLPLFAACAIAVSFGGEASAQTAASGFGTRAENVLVIDEFAGFYRETVYSPDDPKSDEIGWWRFGSHTGFFGINQTTRFGYHRFVAPNISVGAGLHFIDHDQSSIVTRQSVLGLSPRVGFVFASSEGGALWLRFGFQYHHYSLQGDVTAWELGPGVELFYVITPFEHFGITLGPTMELGLAGNYTTKSTVCGAGPGAPGCTTVDHDVALRRRTFGFAVGFLFDL